MMHTAYLSSSQTNYLLKSKIFLEIISILITVILLVLILMPIYLNTKLFPYYFYAAVCIVIVITLTRYIFLLKHSLIARWTIVKIIAGILCVPLFLFAIDGIYEFQRFLDEEGLQSLIFNVDADYEALIINYIRSVVLFFGVSTVILSIVFPFRMVLSVWRVRNRDTV